MPPPPARTRHPYGQWTLRLAISLGLAWICAHVIAAAHWSFLPHDSGLLAGQMLAMITFPVVALLLFTSRTVKPLLVTGVVIGTIALLTGARL